MEHIAKKTCQLAHSHTAYHNKPPAEPHDQHYRSVHYHLKGGHVQLGMAEGVPAGAHEFLVYLVELLFLVRTPNKGFYSPNGGQTLLETAVDMVHCFLLADIEGADLMYDKG